MEGEVLEVPQYIPSVHKSNKPFGFGFACDALKVCSELPDDCHSGASLLSFRKKLKTYLFHRNLPTLGFIIFSNCYSLSFDGD